MLIFDCQSASTSADAGASAGAGVRVAGNSLGSVCWPLFVGDALCLMPGLVVWVWVWVWVGLLFGLGLVRAVFFLFVALLLSGCFPLCRRHFQIHGINLRSLALPSPKKRISSHPVL